MTCPNCKNNLPEDAVFCNVCGSDINPASANPAPASGAIYAPPEGYELDPAGSGRYFSEEIVSDSATGAFVRWVTWFDANTGTYEQESFPIETPAQPQPASPASPPVQSKPPAPPPTYGQPPAPRPPMPPAPYAQQTTTTLPHPTQPVQSAAPVPPPPHTQPTAQHAPPPAASPQKKGKPKAAVIAIVAVVCVAIAGFAIYYFFGWPPDFSTDDNDNAQISESTPDINIAATSAPAEVPTPSPEPVNTPEPPPELVGGYSVLAVGDDERGKKDAVENWENIVDIAVRTYMVVGLKADGTVVAAGDNDDGRCDVSEWRDIIAISTGINHAVGLKSDGTVVAAGNNEDGRCDVSDWRDIVAISAGTNNTVGLKADGTVIVTGDNEYGQCDVSNWRDITSIAAGSTHIVGIKSDGTVVAAGRNNDGRCNVSGWRDIVAVYPNNRRTVGLKADGTVVAVGFDSIGSNDVSDWRDIVALSVELGTTVGLKSDGTVVATGNNYRGMLDVSGWRDIVAISLGFGHTVGLKSDGTVVVAGSNTLGQSDVSGWRNVISIFAGGTNSTIGLVGTDDMFPLPMPERPSVSGNISNIGNSGSSGSAASSGGQIAFSDKDGNPLTAQITDWPFIGEGNYGGRIEINEPVGGILSADKGFYQFTLSDMEVSNDFGLTLVIEAGTDEEFEINLIEYHDFGRGVLEFRRGWWSSNQASDEYITLSGRTMTIRIPPQHYGIDTYVWQINCPEYQWAVDGPEGPYSDTSDLQLKFAFLLEPGERPYFP